MNGFIKSIKNGWNGFSAVMGAFFTGLWKFFFDMVTDPRDMYDDKRVIGLALIIIGMLIGFDILKVSDPNLKYYLIGLGVSLHFGAGFTDGIASRVGGGLTGTVLGGRNGFSGR